MWVLVPVIRVFGSWSCRDAEQFATKEDWASLLVSVEKLEETLARLKGRIMSGGSAGERSETWVATISTAEEFAAAVRGLPSPRSKT